MTQHLGAAAGWLVDKAQHAPEAVRYTQWMANIELLYGDVWSQAKVRAHCERYALKLGCQASPTELLFALQILYSILARAVLFYRWLDQPLAVSETLHRLADPDFYRRQWGVRNLLPEIWDAGYLAFSGEGELDQTFRPVLSLAKQIAQRASSQSWHNLLTDLYENVVSRPIRHDLGEYFTPYWLARKTIEMTGFEGEVDQTLFDPGCGSGAFLLAAAEMKFQANDKPASSEILAAVLHTIIGCDINPLSVLSARLNLVWWLAERFRMPLPDIELPVVHYDSVFGTPLGTSPDILQPYLPDGCDYLIGNPPWISWNALPPEYRKRLEEELLPRYILFDFRGQEARLGHSNDDYLVTFSLVTIDKYLRQGGTCGFIIKQPLLMNVSGKTFRRFAIRDIQGTISLQVKKVADLRQINPFGIANETAIIVLKKGQRTVYPVPYEIWSRTDGRLEITACEAQPSSPMDSTAPWVVLTPELEQTQFMEGRGMYEIRHGLKHDVADVLIIQPVKHRGQVLVIEQASSHEAKSPELYEVEPNLVYPFLQPRHLQAWGTSGYTYAIIPQRKAGENNEQELARALPLTYAYLKRFASAFAARRSRIFSGIPFYGLFGLGDYTWAPYKVCWCGMGFRPEFAVVEEVADPYLGVKPVVPDGTIYFIPMDSREEAHYVCAILNSGLVRTFLDARSGKSKRGLSKKMMEQLRLPLFNPNDEQHLWLADLSLRFHRRARQQREEPASLNDLDDAVEDVFRAEAVGQLSLF